MGLVIRARAVLDAARDDEQLACGQFDVAVAQLNRQTTLEHEEEVVGVLWACQTNSPRALTTSSLRSFR